MPEGWVPAVGARLMGIALLPAVVGAMAAGYELLVDAQKASTDQGPLVMFAMGMMVWLAVFLLLKPSARSYVIAHECSHLLAAWFSGVKAGHLHVGKDSGSVQVARSTIWIALAPYMIPFYSLILLLGHILASLWWDPAAWLPFLPPALGFTWCFHLTFTLQALSVGQSDLKPYGWIGALPLILLANLLLMFLALTAATPRPLPEDLRILLEALQNSYLQVVELIKGLLPEKIP